MIGRVLQAHQFCCRRFHQVVCVSSRCSARHRGNMASAASSASFGAHAITGACLAVAIVLLQCACPVASQGSAVLGKTSATMALGLMGRTDDSAATPAPTPVSPSAPPAGAGPKPTMAASGGRSGLDLTNRPPPVSASAPPGKNPRTPATEAVPPAAATPTAQAAAQPVRPPPTLHHRGCSSKVLFQRRLHS